MFYSVHMNIFQFINVLKNVHKETYIKQRSIRITKNRRMVVCEKEDYLRRNMAKYESGQLSRLDYN
jgi:hypothetical protein